MKKLLKEIIIGVLIFFPYLLMVRLWEKLPNQLPIHFGIEGEPDGWMDKGSFVYLPAVFGIGLYALIYMIPKIDPKKKIELMGEKYYAFRLIMHLLFTGIFSIIIYKSTTGLKDGFVLIYLLLGLFYILMGNYFQTIRPNFFIGIRTPWTLANDAVWKKTHVFGGRLWLGGGIVLVLLFLWTNHKLLLSYAFLSVTAILVFLPIVLSYYWFQVDSKKQID